MEDSGPASITSADESQSDRLTLLLNRLHQYERAPWGIVESWQKTQHDTEDSAARIFLRSGGFPAWFAHFLTKSATEVQYHFVGKADCSRLIFELENEPAISRELAAQVAAAIPPEIRTKIESLYNKRIKPLENGTMSQHSNKRRRTIADNDCPPISTANFPSPTATPSSPNASRLSLDRRSLEQAPGYNSVGCFAEDEHVLVNASLAVATRLLPRDLSNAIRRNPDPRNEGALVAAISMTFPNAPYTDKFGCYMAVEVTSDKVQHLARELFGVRLETMAGLRYVCLAESSAKILANPKFTLQGCQCSIIPSTFGPELSNAIITGPKYQDDARQWRDSTDAVSMVVSHSAHDGAVVYLHLGLWEGTEIKKKLYA
ncbi:uncharacterized protein F5Z01DRAFT_472066 [Emericellopsis atlantica]|uniref:Uncharacterized protein n=1 Tax=Emericellopsis atlantica TaxID=2614577 RepID=A0A9P7ZDA3_9HYPO|nr:uncharacterized protein F5Z01DRAFT_472066 [Emericellopsis atlantica]KAG9249621.1 hypothetical protein F5Z01DRAFT_472066 [Emericellopsis atlantica]